MKENTIKAALAAALGALCAYGVQLLVPVPGFLQALLKKLKVHTEDTAEENLPGEENSDE